MTRGRLDVELDERRIDAIFAELDRANESGAAVGISVGGSPVYRKGFGLASLEPPVAFSPSSRARIGFATMQFTCLAYLLLCEEGRAGIDDRLDEHLPELHAANRNVSMRQLMTHTSGLRDACDIRLQFGGIDGVRTSSQELASIYRDIDDVNAEPGTGWTFNNGGYVLLSVAIERIAEQSLEDVLRQRIFDPLGMHDTQLRRWDGDGSRPYWGMDCAGAGTLVSSADDLLRWLAHMDAPVVGNNSTWALMKTPQTLTNGSSTGYGLGLFLGSYRGVDILHHAGSWDGGNAQLMKVPVAGLDIIVLVNRNDVLGMQLADRILDTVLPGLDAVDPRIDRRLPTGVFRSPTTGRVVQLFETEGQQIASIDGMDLAVACGEDDVWRPTVVGYVKIGLRFPDGEKNPQSIWLEEFGNPDELVRAAPADEAGSTSIAGRYRSDATGTDATISSSDEHRLTFAGRFGSVAHRLECIADRTWRTWPVAGFPSGGILSFDRDDAAFVFSNYQTRNLRFRRVSS